MRSREAMGVPGREAGGIQDDSDAMYEISTDDETDLGSTLDK